MLENWILLDSSDKPFRTILFEAETDTQIESWILAPDIRHEKKGFRASRYIELFEEPNVDLGSANEKVWDEKYMFFETLDAAYAAFVGGDLATGRAAF